MHIFILLYPRERKKAIDDPGSNREEVGYTDFCFIDRMGNYLTVDGKTGYLDLIKYSGSTA